MDPIVTQELRETTQVNKGGMGDAFVQALSEGRSTASDFENPCFTSICCSNGIDFTSHDATP